MDPKIIPYGWGLFSDDDEVLVIEKGNSSLMNEKSMFHFQTTFFTQPAGSVYKTHCPSFCGCFGPQLTGEQDLRILLHKKDLVFDSPAQSQGLLYK